MNIFQKKINRQSRLFMVHTNKFYNNPSAISFKESRIYVRYSNKEENITTLDLINKEIRCINDSIRELDSVPSHL